MDTRQAGDTHTTLTHVILRDVIAADDAALASFNPGSGTPWLDEVQEIVDGLIAWRDDPEERAFDRRVLPDADELSPPEDDPYLSFALGL